MQKTIMALPAPRRPQPQLVPFGRLLVVGAVALLLSSCANFSGIETAVQPGTPGDYAAGASLPAEGGQWPDHSWIAGIGGASLQALVDEVVVSNPGLRSEAALVAAGAVV